MASDIGVHALQKHIDRNLSFRQYTEQDRKSQKVFPYHPLRGIEKLSAKSFYGILQMPMPEKTTGKSNLPLRWKSYHGNLATNGRSVGAFIKVFNYSGENVTAAPLGRSWARSCRRACDSAYRQFPRFVAKRIFQQFATWRYRNLRPPSTRSASLSDL
jgi:hypothetical protein